MADKFEKPLVVGKKQNILDVSRVIKLLCLVLSGMQMCGEIMNEWLLGFDQKMGQQKRRVILSTDNAASHAATGI
ncbi:hypothetical protein PR048_005471 [Dryococelus australis]|uniref:Transposase n=1 Tax=Dryococelus australis TaxID=614101 RepID=A0ABQ9I894_9NEOP|nr:hypothetical protein PR048_005471 [Dryococelus australis]